MTRFPFVKIISLLFFAFAEKNLNKILDRTSAMEYNTFSTHRWRVLKTGKRTNGRSVRIEEDGR